MIEILEKFAKFETTTQILADQARMIIKKGWFSDLEILGILQLINRESSQQVRNTRIEIINTEKQEHSNRIETHIPGKNRHT